MRPQLTVAAVLALAAGCSQPAARVVGTVTRGGQPMAVAAIALEPDGMTGPAAMAQVKDGKFEVGTDKQLTAGKYMVRITPGAWIAGQSQPENFDPYTTSAELKFGDNNLTFDVPVPKKK